VRHVCTSLGFTAKLAALAEALDQRMALYRKWFHPRPGALETLRELKERGYPIGLISMCAPDTPALWRASPLAPYLEVEVFSSEVGLRKPDADIYLLACERLGVVPAACLYCGDGAYGELTGASAVGMTTFLIRDPEFDPGEALRPEGEDWRGAAVNDLRELLAFLPPREV
jgi:putative hydrolase of the HAD superfamily